MDLVTDAVALLDLEGVSLHQHHTERAALGGGAPTHDYECPEHTHTHNNKNKLKPQSLRCVLFGSTTQQSPHNTTAPPQHTQAQARPLPVALSTPSPVPSQARLHARDRRAASDGG